MFKIILVPELKEDMMNYLEAQRISYEDTFTEMNRVWNEFSTKNTKRKGKILYLGKKFSERDFANRLSQVNSSLTQVEDLQRAIR